MDWLMIQVLVGAGGGEVDGWMNEDWLMDG